MIMLNKYESIRHGANTKEDQQLLSWQGNLINEVNFISSITIVHCRCMLRDRYKSRCLTDQQSYFPKASLD